MNRGFRILKDGWKMGKDMKKKTIAIILLSVIAVFVLAGCDKKEKDTKEQSVKSETKISDKSENEKNQEDSKENGQKEQESIPKYAADIKGVEKFQEAVDYADSDNWLSFPEDGKNPVDVIYLYPTVYGTLTKVSDDVADVDNITMRLGAAFSMATQAGVFEKSCNIYAPVYRQLTVSCLLGLIENNQKAMLYVASQDLYHMLDYYFEHCNQGKPFILAGHSQGSVWLTVILEDYMKRHPEYLKNMVAAYVIGYSVTKEYLEKNPHLKFAERANDTGVIISYNTEGAGNKNQYNCVVREGAVAINPINWKRDDTYAPAETNLGSLSLKGEMVSDYADARVDLERGVVVCESIEQSRQMQKLLKPYFGSESYHLSDYSLYYANLQQNAEDRIQAFLQNRIKDE